MLCKIPNERLETKSAANSDFPRQALTRGLNLLKLRPEHSSLRDLRIACDVRMKNICFVRITSAIFATGGLKRQ